MDGCLDVGGQILYKAETVGLNLADCEIVADLVSRFRGGDDDRFPTEIELISSSELRSPEYAPGVEAARRLIACVGDSSFPISDRFAILSCMWAAPHVDDTFDGSLFVSVVVRTGPSPYVMQTLRTGAAEDGAPASLITNTRVLNVGDVVVFDPTAPHYAFPQRPSEQSLLVLLQVELTGVSAMSAEKRQSTLPQAAGDGDEDWAFHTEQKPYT